MTETEIYHDDERYELERDAAYDRLHEDDDLDEEDIDFLLEREAEAQEFWALEAEADRRDAHLAAAAGEW
jgi:hypothetical protein